MTRKTHTYHQNKQTAVHTFAVAGTDGFGFMSL